jgi:Penicillinase repressor
MAARADCGRTFCAVAEHFDALLVGAETGVLIDKTSKMLAAVQDRGQFHSAKAGVSETSTINRLWALVRDGSPGERCTRNAGASRTRAGPPLRRREKSCQILTGVIDSITRVRLLMMALPKLSKLELIIMEALWTKGPCSIREIHETFPARSRPTYSTV